MSSIVRGALFLYAALALALAVAFGPLDRLADHSFAWHMFEHLLLMLVVSLLVVLGHAGTLAMRVLPARASVYAVGVLRSRAVRALTAPPSCLAIFTGTMWLSHYSGLYEAALEHPPVHIAEHAVYAIAGVFFWIPVVSQAPLPVLPFAGRVFYLFAALPQSALVAFTLSDARAPLYPHYVHVLGTAALADQRNAAAVLWIGGGAIVLVAILATMGAWARRERAKSAQWRVTECVSS